MNDSDAVLRSKSSAHSCSTPRMAGEREREREPPPTPLDAKAKLAFSFPWLRLSITQELIDENPSCAVASSANREHITMILCLSQRSELEPAHGSRVCPLLHTCFHITFPPLKI